MKTRMRVEGETEWVELTLDNRPPVGADIMVMGKWYIVDKVTRIRRNKKRPAVFHVEAHREVK